ncbi:MAG TPA: hypothetical protein VJT75_17725 [Thermoleophilaceae bacterium]|nr:hypothetical protein [Thermoleophilaceae bacterium]
MPSTPPATIPGVKRAQLVRAIRRGLAAAAAEPPATPRHDPAPAADDARLDALRGELVRELDRLAAADQACSADFRRVA